MEGIVVRVMREKKYGFIKGPSNEYFFHADDLHGFFEDLVEDLEMKQVVKVSFEVVPSLKGPRAGNVIREDGGVSIPDQDSTA